MFFLTGIENCVSSKIYGQAILGCIIKLIRLRTTLNCQNRLSCLISDGFNESISCQIDKSSMYHKLELFEGI